MPTSVPKENLPLFGFQMGTVFWLSKLFVFLWLKCFKWSQVRWANQSKTMSHVSEKGLRGSVARCIHTYTQQRDKQHRLNSHKIQHYVTFSQVWAEWNDHKITFYFQISSICSWLCRSLSSFTLCLAWAPLLSQFIYAEKEDPSLNVFSNSDGQ